MIRVAQGAGRMLLAALLRALPTLLAVTVISFFLMKLAPGDAVDAMAAEMGGANADMVAAWRHDLGLDRSLGEQLLAYLGHIARFDLGYSPIYNMPVSTLIAERLPATMILMASAMSLALLLGIAAGVFMAQRRGSAADHALAGFLQLFYSVPAFCTGLILILIFSIKLRWLPIGDAETIGGELSGLPLLKDRLLHLILPTVTLALFFLAIYARIVRTAMIEVAEADYVRAALARGISERRIVWKHMLRNALLPVVSIAGSHAGAIVSGAVTVEAVFNWPGMGRLAFEAVLKRDFTVLLGILLLSALLVILANILVDLLHAWIDPRVERA